MLGIKSDIDIQDILYGGIAGEVPLPDVIDNGNILFSDTDSKPSLSSEKYQDITQEPPEIISYSEAISAAASSENVDIR